MLLEKNVVFLRVGAFKVLHVSIIVCQLTGHDRHSSLSRYQETTPVCAVFSVDVVVFVQEP